MNKFTVTRSKWGRGEGGGYLLDTYIDRMCCLGFVALALGADNDDIENVAMPSELENFDQLDTDFKFVEPIDQDTYKEDLKSGLSTVLSDTKLSTQAAAINDDMLLDDARREAKLIELFNEHNLELTFVD